MKEVQNHTARDSGIDRSKMSWNSKVAASYNGLDARSHCLSSLCTGPALPLYPPCSAPLFPLQIFALSSWATEKILFPNPLRPPHWDCLSSSVEELRMKTASLLFTTVSLATTITLDRHINCKTEEWNGVTSCMHSVMCVHVYTQCDVTFAWQW